MAQVRLVAQSGASSDGEAKKEVALQLSPFVVAGDDTEGYRSQRTMVGSRSSADLINIPASVGLINLEQLNDLGAISPHDAIRYGVSGVTSNQTFNDDFNIRGFRIAASQRNGVEQSPSNGRGDKTTPMYDVERMEVLKGPTAMLSGANGGIGGSINYVSRTATATPKGEAQISLTDAGQVRFQGNFSGPLKKSKDFSLNYRLTLGGIHSDAPHGKSLEWEDQQFYGGGVAMYFGSASSLIINAYYFVNNDYLYLEDFLDISVPVNPRTGLTDAKFNKYSTQSYSPGRQQDAFWPIRDAVVDATYLTRLTENGNLRLAYYYYDDDDSRRNNRAISVQADNYTLNRQDIRNHNGNISHNFQLDYLHHLEWKAIKVDTTLGASGTDSKSFENQSITFMPSLDSRTGLYPDDAAWFAQFPDDNSYFIKPRPPAVGNPATRTKTHITQSSRYIQENVSFWRDRLILVGGLRWFSPGGTNENLVSNTITNRPSDSFRTHKYGLVLKLLPSVSLYVTDAQNVFPAALGFTDRFIQGDQLGEAFKASLGKLKEAGVKFDLKLNSNITLYGSAAAFKMEQTNIRTFGVLPEGLPGAQGVIQSAKDSAAGWETDVGVQIKTGTGRADIVMTYFHGNSAVADDAGKAYVRQTNAFVPQKFSIFGKYSWSSGTLRGVRAGAGFEVEHDKRYGAFMLVKPLTADAFIGYVINKRWDLQLNLNNLTNKRYIQQTATNGLVQGSDTFRSKLTVKYTW
jgi:iron complex outermembrane receptor protein